jgi:hypothetical protein
VRELPEAAWATTGACGEAHYGLRLDATRGTISTMVIESIERPSEN